MLSLHRLIYLVYEFFLKEIISSNLTWSDQSQLLGFQDASDASIIFSSKTNWSSFCNRWYTNISRDNMITRVAHIYSLDPQCYSFCYQTATFEDKYTTKCTDWFRFSLKNETKRERMVLVFGWCWPHKSVPHDRLMLKKNLTWITS
jgi:hypothetical protein